MTLATFVPETLEDYERAAREYEASLTLEDIMENTHQGTQREITMHSLNAMKDSLPQLQYFNELLVQHFANGESIQVVPDNMLLLTPHPLQYRGSFNLKFEPVWPLMTMEYVSSESAYKDYEVNLAKYFAIRVKYCVIFDPFTHELQVHRWMPDGYVRLEPNLEGRVEIPDLDMQLGVLDGWMRFWHAGKLMAAPNELVRENKQLVREKEQLARENQQLLREKQQSENAATQWTETLRTNVARFAQQKNRQDIVDQLASCTDTDQLMRWLTELSS